VRFKSLELENIRSYNKGYERNRVEFPEGSVLLAGDIGAGKSSLLLAIEFALFGIRRGELRGESLLRRGRRSGGVRVNLTIAGKDIVIERRLTRTTQGVRQESGHIIIDGVKREGTAQELKAWILNLLGYPQELLQKQKSLLYRYTVYTPQERIKQIIRTDKETRLNVLRKIFGVDRYKTVRENTFTFLTNLRMKKRELKALYRDLKDRQEEKKQKKTRLVEVEGELKKLRDRERKIKSKLRKWKKEREEIQEQIGQYIKNDKELGKNKERLDGVSRQLEETNSSLEKCRKALRSLRKLRRPTEKSERELQKEIEKIQLNIENYIRDPKGLDPEVDSLIKEIEKVQGKSKRNKENQVSLDTKVDTARQRFQRLKSAGSVCPICGKELDEEHRSMRMKEYSKEINEYTEEKRQLERDEKELKMKTGKLEELVKEKVSKKVIELRGRKQRLEITLKSLREYETQMEKKHDLEGQIGEFQERSKALKDTKKETEETIRRLEGKLKELDKVEEKRKRIEVRIEKFNQELTNTKAKMSGKETTRKNLLERIGELENDLKEMIKAKNFEERLAAYEGWMQKYIMNLTATIEKHYMIEIRRQFEPLFQDWFNLLMEDEDLTVKVDEEFSPITEQQGYEAEFENLSGGESTSVAMAYRLALNRIINTMIEGIQTKDVIILDEPTDGFSEAQLDKIRDVLNQLNTPQTIIVSHEPKIESYVDNIIHVYKEGGISRIQNKNN